MSGRRKRWPWDARPLQERKTEDQVERERRALREKEVRAIIEAGNARGRKYRETWAMKDRAIARRPWVVR